MELPIVSALEFEQIKSSIKSYIQSKTDFKDYDFEGSNLSMLIDILSYNTLYTSYNVNMSSNELNLDTAVLRDNVVSIAKRLGYNPSSYTSASVSLDIKVSEIQNYDSVRIEAGPILAASANGKNYTFILRDPLEIDVRSRSEITFKNIEVLEGSDFSISYTVDSSNENQRFFIPNSYVDVETIRAFVIADPTTNIEQEYERKYSIVDVSSESKIFFVEEVQDQKYEVIFGDDVFGRKLKNGEIVRLQYVVSAGSQANNIKTFDFVGVVKGLLNNIENVLGISKITTTLLSEFSDGGSEFENIRSIKYAAPRKYASQERTVTVSDYETIVRQIYPNADLVKVIGGEFFTPPRFGKVFIIIKPIVGERVSNIEKERIKNELKKYQVGSIATEIVDPDYMDIFITPIILYDNKKTRKSSIEIISLVNQKVLEYILDPEFNAFGGVYSNSKLICDLKELDSAIKFVQVRLYLKKVVKLFNKIDTKYFVDFNTKLKTNTKYPFYVISDPFCATGVASPVFLAAVGQCDYSGDLNLYTVGGVYVRTVGKVNVTTGEIEFNLNACQSDPINIYVIPDITEVIAAPNTTPNIVVEDIIVTDEFTDTDLLDPDQNNLPTQIITSTPSTGDPTASNTNYIPFIIPSPGGSIPYIPSIPQEFAVVDQFVDPDDPTGGNDQNNIIAIDDYTPEIDPNTCS